MRTDYRYLWILEPSQAEGGRGAGCPVPIPPTTRVGEPAAPRPARRGRSSCAGNGLAAVGDFVAAAMRMAAVRGALPFRIESAAPRIQTDLRCPALAASPARVDLAAIAPTSRAGEPAAPASREQL
jgi:hypothetical protein